MRRDALDQRRLDRRDRFRLRLLPGELGDLVESREGVVVTGGRGVVVVAVVFRAIELMDIRQVERTARVDRRGGIAANDLHLEFRPPFFRDAGVVLENAAIAEVVREPFVDDDIRGDQQKVRRHRGVGFAEFVEVGPDDGEAHHLRLAAARRHLRGVAGEKVVGGDVGARRAVRQDGEIAQAARAVNFVAEDKRFDRFPLGEVPAPRQTADQMLLGEPPREQPQRRRRRARIARRPPRRDLLTEDGHEERIRRAARRGLRDGVRIADAMRHHIDTGLEDGFGRLNLPPRHGTSTFRLIVVSLPKMSTTLTTTV